MKHELLDQQAKHNRKELKTLSELEALMALAMMPALGSVRIRLLMNYFGSAWDALQADPSEVAGLPGFGPKIMAGWKTGENEGSWQKNWGLAERLGAKIVPFTSPEFPKRLLEISDHPVLLYIRGNLEDRDQRSIAVVGTRQASIYGYEMAKQIASGLTAYGYTVVSGLARGIDTAAHAGALEFGRTIAVIGSGLADIYPQENQALAEAIVNKGALVSEFPMATPPDRQNFPQRNRIVSGMTLGTVLIEAPVKSGAMITMERAFAQGRQLFALPGRADLENFKGNHALIKSGRAGLVECAEDIVQKFEDFFGGASQEPKLPSRLGVVLEKEEADLLGRLPSQEISIEEIVQSTKLPIARLNVLLMSLVLKKVIKEYPGKIYKKAR